MRRKTVITSINRIKIIENIAILFCFMLYPSLQGKIYENCQYKSNLCDYIKIYGEDRAYASELNSNRKVLPSHIAPNMHIGHELSTLFSLESMHWNIEQKDRNSFIPPNFVEKSEVSLISPGVFLRYEYHVPFSINSGFFLGTTAGATFLSAKTNSFKSGYGIFFPTILVGFTGTPVEQDRIALGAEYGAVWYPDMTLVTVSHNNEPLNATLGTLNFYLANDYFFSSDIAFRASGGVRLIDNVCWGSCSEENYIQKFKIRNMSIYMQVGIVFGDIR